MLERPSTLRTVQIQDWLDWGWSLFSFLLRTVGVEGFEPTIAPGEGRRLRAGCVCQFRHTPVFTLSKGRGICRKWSLVSLF